MRQRQRKRFKDLESPENCSWNGGKGLDASGSAVASGRVATANMFARAPRDRRPHRHLDAYFERKSNSELALVFAWGIVIGASHN